MARQDEEQSFISDLTAYNSSLKQLANIYSQDPNMAQEIYTGMRPALEKVARGKIPDQITPDYLEAGLVYTGATAPRLQEYREAISGNLLSQQSRAGMPFDPNNAVDAQFLDEKGRPSFDNNNYKEFMRTRDVPEEMIEAFDSRYGNNVIQDMEKMRPEEQLMLVDMMSKMAEADAKQQLETAKVQAKEAKDNPLRFTKPTQTAMQAKIEAMENQQAQLLTIEANTNPEYFEYQKQGRQFTAAALQKIGMSQEAAAQEVKAFQAWKTQAETALVEYIKSVSGAAVTEQEAERLRKLFANGQMSKDQFAGALSALKNNAELIRSSTFARLQNGKVQEKSIAKTLEEAGAFQPLFPNASVSKYKGKAEGDIISSVMQQHQQGVLNDNTLSEAAEAAYASRGGDWSKLSDEAKQKRVSMFGQIIQSNVGQ